VFPFAVVNEMSLSRCPIYGATLCFKKWQHRCDTILVQRAVTPGWF